MKENRSVRKTALVVNLTALFFACSVYQIYVFVDTHPARVEWLGYYLPALAYPLMVLFPVVIGYWCYLLARNLANFLIGQGPQAKSAS